MKDDDNTAEQPSEATIFRVLTQIGVSLGISIEHAHILAPDDAPNPTSGDPLDGLIASAAQSGIFVREIVFDRVDEAIGFVEEGYPIIVIGSEGTFVTVCSVSGKRFETTTIGRHVSQQTVGKRNLAKLVLGNSDNRTFIAKRELQCDALSAASHDMHSDEHHVGISPLRRFFALLDMDRRDILTVTLFAFVSGVLTLATPLAVESLVNVVSWGTHLQPLIVLGMILFICLGIAGCLRVLQTVLVELIQRRQFVRIVSDLSHRFPRANQEALYGTYPRELANRVFDIMTIQKSTANLLLDGVSIVLTTVLGLVLLAFYHPFLLGFDIVLLFAMISITWILGRGGIRTAIQESKSKYQVAHWLQDVIASPAAFKCGGGEGLSIHRANTLTAEYITARQQQFRVVLRQVVFAVSLQVLASTAVLGLGGWLVIQGQLTLGQLVASELVVTVIVGAFAKAGKSLEKYYDLMAGVDKVGQLLDIPTDPRHEIGSLPQGPIEIRWGDLTLTQAVSKSRIAAKTIKPGACVAIVGENFDGKANLARAIAGLWKPADGFVQVGGFDAQLAATGRGNRLVGYAGEREIFKATLRENIELGRPGISQARIREVLDAVGLTETVLRLACGLLTPLQTGGYPLSDSQVAQLLIARAIVTKPNAIVINGLLDQLAPQILAKIWESLTSGDPPWTLVVCTNCVDVADLCDSQICIPEIV